MEIATILTAFGIYTENSEIKPLGDGLINKTWITREISTGRIYRL